MAKVVHTHQIVVLNILSPFRMTPCPPGLQLYRLHGNEEQKLFIQCNGDSCPENPNSCQDYPLSSHTPVPKFVDGGHLDG